MSYSLWQTLFETLDSRVFHNLAENGNDGMGIFFPSNVTLMSQNKKKRANEMQENTFTMYNYHYSCK